jgi:serine/threonine-protein kinase HipA
MTGRTSRGADELMVLLSGIPIGSVRQLASGKLQFAYAASWLEADTGLPLSISMPLVAPIHGNGPISAFMWGLLPDNEQILDGIAKRNQCSSRNPFALLRATGEDCAGAVQFVRPERVEALADGAEGIEWLDERAVAERIRLLRKDAGSVGRMANDPGSFSVAGAQPKTALLRSQDGRWAIPSGGVPTTHILKPSALGLAGHVENEHFCQLLAQAAGLRSAISTVERFEDEVVIASRRYDRRTLPDGRIQRIHQEDMCQALGVPPWTKYEKDGGPGAARIANEILAFSSRPDADRATFMDAVAFNFVVLGTDAHAKNFSVLLAAGNAMRLAPLYDIASVLPYPHIRDAGDLKLAMSADRYYRPGDIQPRHWQRLAQRASYDPDALLASLGRYVRELPDLASDVAAGCRSEGLDVPVIDELVDGIAGRCAKLAAQYAPMDADAPAGPRP